MDLNLIWFVLVVALFAGYVVLDGFDLGVGAIYLFVKKDEDRRILLNAIGPVWDGNEAWLVTGGGALFAVFPKAYATVFSSFYVPFMLLLVSLIFRAVAIEFRGKLEWKWWRALWDVSFAAGSVVSAFLIGVTAGNLVRGLPLDAEHEFTGTLSGLLNPYAITMGLMAVILLAMHGAIYLVLKTEGSLQGILRGWASYLIRTFTASYFIFGVFTLIEVPRMANVVQERSYIPLVAIAGIFVIVNIAREMGRGRNFRAFLSSSIGVVIIMGAFALTAYPFIVYSDPAINSLTVYNAASSAKTLRITLLMAAIGLPLVLFYTITVYFVFRGKTLLVPHSY